MNELVEGILKVLEDNAWTYDEEGRLAIIGKGEFRQAATAIAERLVVDDEKIFKILLKQLTATRQQEFLLCDNLAKKIAEAKPIKVKEEQ